MAETKDDPKKLSDDEVRQQESLVNTSPTPILATDALGVQRIVMHDPGTWSPAQVEPDEHEVARLSQLQDRLNDKRDARISELRGDEGRKIAQAALKAEQVGAPAPKKGV